MIVGLVLAHPFLTALAVLIVVKLILTKRCTLPGPWGAPIVGYLPFLGKYPYVTLTELGKTYGEVFQISAGMRTMVVLNSPAAIQKAYGSDASFNGRPKIPSMETFAESGPSRFAFKDGDQRWRFLRKNATRGLGMFASSRNSKLQAVVTEGMNRFFEEIDLNLGKPVKANRLIFETVAGIVGSLMFGFDFDPKNPILTRLLGVQEKLGKFFSVGALMDNVPFGRYIFHNKRIQFLNDVKGLSAITEQFISQRTYHGSEDAVRDIADALTKAAAEVPKAELDKIGISAEQIRYISQDLFGAGFATTMDSLIWLINLTAANKDVQNRVHKELADQLGDKDPTLEDRANLPFVEAVLYEGFRIASLVPLGIPHATRNDTTIDGMFVPKGCTVFANFYGIHRDATVFLEPDKFNPARFIKTDGNLDVDLGAKVMPFSTGKRRCVGENLARQEIALIYTSIMQRYSIDFAPGQNVNLEDSAAGFTRSPMKYEMIFRARE